MSELIKVADAWERERRGNNPARTSWPWQAA
jgi:hypothetical protein